VNNMRAGAPDKVVYEAAASCVPVLASNPVFDTLLDERFRFAREEPAELAERLVDFARMDAEARRAVGRELRRRVEEGHAVDRWAERLLAVAEAR
jgi:glycosyltransferase involved in cell wall biosynthesis